MALNTIYMLRLRQLWGAAGKPQENVFFYDHTAGTGVAIDLAQTFENQILPLINAIQSDAIVNNSLTIINLGDLADFIDYPLTDGGDYSGESLPPYAAVGYTMKLSTRAVRNGSKRFSGIVESVQSNGVITDATFITKQNALKSELALELTDVADTYLPVVIKRVKEPVVGTVPLKYTYRLPTTDGELTVGEVVTVLTSVNLTHQVSREL